MHKTRLKIVKLQKTRRPLSRDFRLIKIRIRKAATERRGFYRIVKTYNFYLLVLRLVRQFIVFHAKKDTIPYTQKIASNTGRIYLQYTFNFS